MPAADFDTTTTEPVLDYQVSAQTGRYTAYTDRAYFYDEPHPNTRRGGYLAKGDEVEIILIQEGFGYAVFTSPSSGTTTKGWLQLADLSKKEAMEQSAETPPEEETDNEADVIYDQVEVEASFPGGAAAWKKYLERNLNASLPNDKGAPEGAYTVLVQFLISQEGAVSEVRSLTEHGYGMEEEAVRVISEGPVWIPALQKGRQVKAYRKQPITFVITAP